MARPRQRNRRDRGVDGRARRAAHQGAQLHLLRDVPRAGRCPATKPVNDSQAMYGHGRLSPTWMKAVSEDSRRSSSIPGSRPLRRCAPCAIATAAPMKGGPRIHAPPNRRPGAADPSAAGCSSSVPERLRARRSRQRRLLRRAGKGPQHHRRQAIRLEQGRHPRASVVGAARARQHRKRRCDPLFNPRPAGDRGARLLPRRKRSPRTAATSVFRS